MLQDDCLTLGPSWWLLAGLLGPAASLLSVADSRRRSRSTQDAAAAACSSAEVSGAMPELAQRVRVMSNLTSSDEIFAALSQG